MDVHKVTLSSQKVVYLRDPKIGDQELATQAASNRVGHNSAQAVLAIAMQAEFLKVLLQQVDDKKVGPQEVENLDSLLSFREYRECLDVIAELTGMGVEDAGKKFKREVVNSGNS